jgi:DNA helicase-2/ATP-dependent DNA helicase PcrA
MPPDTAGKPAVAHGQLEAFLEEACLVNETDAWQADADRVTLMTLHASKGLEFPAVYLTAVEEGILPHQRSREHPEQLEEERRLMFVGITRAQQELQISMARWRDFRGQRTLTIPSSFLMELPRGEMDVQCASEPSATDHASHGARLVQPCPSTAEQASSGTRVQLAGECEAREPHSAVVFDSGSARTTVGQANRGAPITTAALTTAAALANGGQHPRVDPDAFRQGSMVLHHVYGLGRIVALSGTGARRKATIDFLPPAGRKKLPLAQGDLQPVGP